jgi:hypothetical protein
VSKQSEPAEGLRLVLQECDDSSHAKQLKRQTTVSNLVFGLPRKNGRDGGGSDDNGHRTPDSPQRAQPADVDRDVLSDVGD